MGDIKSIEDISKFLIDRGQKLRPVTVEDLSLLEQEFHVQLPLTYKRFLLLMGRGAGSFMLGSSVFFEDVFYLREWTEELIRENNLENLPKDSFVFWMHQGYQAAYFKITGEDDPPVYYFSEGSNKIKFEIFEKTITDFFINQLIMSFPLPGGE
jgi:SMI1-KNR4 cell-wall